MQAQRTGLKAQSRAALLVPSGRVRRAIKPVMTAADTATAESNSTDAASKLKAVNIAVFSAQGYVLDFLEKPLTSIFPSTKFIPAALDQTTAKLAAGSDVVCVFVNDTVDSEVVDIFAEEGVKLIALRCAGFDRVNVGKAAEKGIKVVRVPTYSPTSVAEHAVTLVFALNRNIHTAHARVAQGNYSLGGLVGMELTGKTVAVLGTGAIGAEAVRLFHGLGMKVLAYDIRPNPKVEALGVPYKSVEEILPVADVVTVHVPLLPSTYHFINKERISQLKPGAILINVSRGGLVDTGAVVDGLESGQIGGLGMDVYENEGKLFFTDWTSLKPTARMKNWDKTFKNLISYPQAIITPHSAFLTNEALKNIADTTVENIKNFTLGKELQNEVKPM